MKNRLSYALAAFLGIVAPASAQNLDEVAQVQVIPGWSTTSGKHIAGLRITLAPGWKTYWRAPGDAGIPPVLNLERSSNIAGVELTWPVPTVFDQGGMRSIGYESGVVVPVTVTPRDAAAPKVLAGELQIGVCEEICIPMIFAFEATLPDSSQRDPAIIASLLDQPMPAEDAGVTRAVCRMVPSDLGMTLTAELDLPPTGGYEHVVIEAGDPYIWVSEPDTIRQGGTLSATVDLVHTEYDSFAIERANVRITVLGTERAVDVQGCQAG